MAFFTGADLISGGSAVLGAIGANRANDAAHDLSADQFAWSLNADKWKYQRAADDLQKAGFNRMLAVSGGIHGGTPSGGSTPSMHNPAEGLNSALSLRTQQAQIENIKADTGLKASSAKAALATAAHQGASAQAVEASVPGIAGKSSALNLLQSPASDWKRAQGWITDKIGQNIHDVWAAGRRFRRR